MQTVMLIYKLFGGSVNSGVPGEPTNMFNYSGPRGVKVRRRACLCARRDALVQRASGRRRRS